MQHRRDVQTLAARPLRDRGDPVGAVRDQGVDLAVGLMFITDIHSLGVEQFSGTQFTDAWYWNFDDQNRAWADKFKEKTNTRPSFAHAGNYSAALQYLEAIQEAGTDDADAIVAAVDGRRVVMIVCTHGHNDHINAAVAVAERVGAPIALHPNDRMLWDAVHPHRAPDLDLADGQVISVGGAHLTVLHTPGHSPGSVCLHGDGILFSGDTLFQGEPGATGRSYSDFDTIIASIRDRLLVLPAGTVVHTGHGDTTTIGDEAGDLDDWIARGH